jgi:hypothetical protein
MERKLNFELVPDGCWYVNLRSHLKKTDWEKLKAYARSKANGKCAICGRAVKFPDTHEVWSYDEEKAVQKLEDIIAICKDCHSVIHIGRTQLLGDIERAENHYMKVNGVSYAEYRSDLGKANEIHKRRNLIPEWITDITLIERIFKEI